MQEDVSSFMDEQRDLKKSLLPHVIRPETGESRRNLMISPPPQGSDEHFKEPAGFFDMVKFTACGVREMKNHKVLRPVSSRRDNAEDFSKTSSKRIFRNVTKFLPVPARRTSASF
jgi:hypothetical protein